MTPEGKVKKFIDDYMKKHFPDAWKYSPPGGMYGKAGAPDRIWFWQGVMITIEAKAEGNFPTELQLRNLEKLYKNGAIVAVVTGKDEVAMESIRQAAQYFKSHNLGFAIIPTAFNFGCNNLKL